MQREGRDFGSIASWNEGNRVPGQDGLMVLEAVEDLMSMLARLRERWAPGSQLVLP